jgi:hypothetical protein
MVEAITGAVDFASIVTGAGVVFGALAIAYVAFKGGKMLLSIIRG